MLMLTGRPPLWAMIGLEALTGTGVAIFYPASQALLPACPPWHAAGRKRDQPPGDELRSDVGAARPACWLRRRGQAGPCAVRIGMVATVPLLLSIRGGQDLRPHPGAAPRAGGGAADSAAPSMLTELREGWSEFRSQPGCG